MLLKSSTRQASEEIIQMTTVGNVTHLFFFFFNELVICVFFLILCFYMSVYLFWLSQRQFSTLVDNKDIIITTLSSPKWQ